MIKNNKIKFQPKLGQYPVEQNARTVPIHLQDEVGRKQEKILQTGYLEKMNDNDEDCFVSPVVIT